ncbi:hypothetical protein BsWGS_03424 [Bradybaena similaris]
MDPVKIAVVGSPKVGKTAIVRQYTTGSFSEANYIPTADNSFIIRREIKGKLYELEIEDTAGSREHARAREIAIANADAFVVVYSVANLDSFLDSKDFIQMILEIKAGHPVPIMLVGNKIDLDEENRVVSLNDAEALARKYNTGFLEVSAKEGKLVDDVFSELMAKVEKRRLSRMRNAPSLKDEKRCCCLL